MENDEIICGTCLDPTDEKLYNIKDLILNHNCSYNTHMNCFLKCIINKPHCLICHENIVLNKTVIEYILNIFTNNNVMIKTNRQNDIYKNKIIQDIILDILNQIQTNENLNSILSMNENTNFINENSINLNIDELIELNNLDIIYDILSFKYPYIKNNISLGLETSQLHAIDIREPAEENIDQYNEISSNTQDRIFHTNLRRTRTRTRVYIRNDNMFCKITKYISSVCYKNNVVYLNLLLIFVAVMLYLFSSN